MVQFPFEGKGARPAKGGMSAVERLAASKLKYVKRRNLPVVSGGAQSHSQGQDNVVRRSSSKKRPDSLLLYRQKCELLKRSTNDRDKRSKARRLLLSSVDKNVSLPEATDKECMSEGDDVLTPKGSANECHPRDREPVRKAAVLRKPNHRRVAEVQQRSRTGVSRSHSDISSRYSKNFADFDAFFKYCGLDGEVIESLGKENFSARSDELAIKIRSVSVSTSDDGFSRSSGDSDGLLEEELHENIRQGTSVIERNARIIKWLYSCKNAKETGKKLRELH
uniref:Family with sequence similarity 110 member C n=1 Tax=Myripristis murdjan TaxID=586833 RepID=A0A667ZV19_9TELE